MTSNLIESVETYKQRRPLYESYCGKVKEIIIAAFTHKFVSHHTIEARAKTVESFARKGSRPDKQGNPKYLDAINQITDLAAVRIIVYTLSDVELACKVVEELFEIDQKTNVGEERIEQGKFGYQSIHYLIRFTNARSTLIDFQIFQDLVCEIQVRTVLQHAWAEIEHDIQYKSSSDLPKSIERKFLSLAGLIEIADREFQSIQDEDARIKESIKDNLKDELTRESLEISAQSEVKPKAKQRNIQSANKVRDFINTGDYNAAVEIYDQKIAQTPTMDTLYLGRAKAKFLLGDRNSALDDLRKAIDLNPNSTPAAELASLMREGNLFRPASVIITSPAPRDPAADALANLLTKEGHELLEAGDGVGAYEKYSSAQSAGASRPFSIYNKAMACVLASDLAGAEDLLTSLRPRQGTPMAVNVDALLCIIEILQEGRKNTRLDKFKDFRDQIPDYSFQMSPLKKMQKLILTSDDIKRRNISEIFELLGAESL